jgi:hypothetical protein
MTRILIAAVVAALVAGCASPKYNYAPVSTAISEPPIGSVTLVRIGDTMLRQGRYREHDALLLRAPRDVSWAYTLHPGYYLKDGADEDAEYYSPGRGDDGGRVEKAAIADPWKSVMAKRKTPELCIVTVFNVATCKEVQDIERTKKPVLAQDSFQQTLIYNGRVGSKINVGYREFSNSFARPAFNNNVEYDLSESMRIGYKGAELEVLEATNQHIKFRMLRNFNDTN